MGRPELDFSFPHGGNMTMTGKNNSAFGLTALQANSAGSFNSAFGNAALAANTAGQSNSAFGNEALQDNKNGVANSAFGAYALLSNTSGGANVAVGDGALTNLQTGGSNIAIGTGAGGELTSENNNIDIGNSGSISESGAIHIGTGGTQTKTFIAGIFSSASAFGIPVLVNNSGQLGTTLSSQRYKEQISDLGAESDVLMKLRPVSSARNHRTATDRDRGHTDTNQGIDAASGHGGKICAAWKIRTWSRYSYRIEVISLLRSHSARALPRASLISTEVEDWSGCCC